PPDMTSWHTLPDDLHSPADQGQPATFRNTETHWWDASQIYGSDLKTQRAVRTDPATGQLRADGKLHLDARGHLPVDPQGDVPNLELAGVNGNWWVGLSVMQTLFAREHNAIVIGCVSTIPRPMASGCFRRRGSSTPPSSPRSTRLNGRRHC